MDLANKGVSLSPEQMENSLLPIQISSFDELENAKEQLEVNKYLLIKKGLSSDNPNEILKAAQHLQEIKQHEENDRKSIIIDPLQLVGALGYKDKPTRMTYEILRSMSRTPIINSIIKTRQNQVASFACEQEDKYSLGFKIRRKLRRGEKAKEDKKDFKRIDYITNFILNCGDNSNKFVGDDFDSFIRKMVRDSYSLDQMCFEVVNNRKGFPCEFFAVDGATMRKFENFDEDDLHNQIYETKLGYSPDSVQVLNSEIKAHFYPWEMCFGIRNPHTDIRMNGYGFSELEELMTVITSLLWSDEYNRKFFSQGASPKGILKISGQNLNQSRLQEFKQQWIAQIAGVSNAWKTPVLEAEKADWIDLQKSNTDMEWSKWNEYLIKIACSIFCIDPSEIGFNLSGSDGAKPLFEGNNESRLKHSKDKGLYPMLKFFSAKMNKFIISRIDPEFEFVFMGLNGMTMQEEVEFQIKQLSNFKTLNEIRTENGLKPLGKEGDIVLNSIYLQNLNMVRQEEQQQQSTEQVEGEQESENPFEQGGEGDESENPFEKGLLDFLKDRK